MRIYSEPGLGTVFTILLPVTAQPAAVPAQRSEPQHGHGETVLVVEDEPAMREVTRRILEHNGYQGRELADKIRILRPGIRVAFMSGYTQGLLSQQRVLEPGVYLIEKPFTETTLLAKVREILTAETPRRSTASVIPGVAPGAGLGLRRLSAATARSQTAFPDHQILVISQHPGYQEVDFSKSPDRSLIIHVAPSGATPFEARREAPKSVPRR